MPFLAVVSPGEALYYDGDKKRGHKFLLGHFNRAHFSFFLDDRDFAVVKATAKRVSFTDKYLGSCDFANVQTTCRHHKLHPKNKIHFFSEFYLFISIFAI